MTEATDAELLERYLRGETRAFDEIVTRYEPRVFAVAARMCGSREDAADVTQDVFITAMRALHGFRSESQLGTWFHRVAVNASLDRLRKRKRSGTTPLEALAEQPARAPGPEDAAIASVRAAEVQRALAELTPDHRAVIVLFDLQRLEYLEVAEALGVPVGTVKSRLHRARAELARLLGHLREQSTDANPLKDCR